MERRNNLLKDGKGFNFRRHRQRLRISEIQCPLACQRVINDHNNGPTSITATKFTNKFLGHNESGGSDESKSSLNATPAPWEYRLRSSKPRKRALLIGVTYTKSKYRLEGSINDVKNMRKLLLENFGYQKYDILVLTGISLLWCSASQATMKLDFNRDEHDGFDEAICPTDYLEEGMILDNDINSTIVWPLPYGVTLHSIVDACHSGTILDLLYVYDIEKKCWIDNSPPNGARKHTNGRLAISISACEDNQTAAETTDFGGKEVNGALTYILIEIVKKYPGVTYGDLIEMIHETIEDVNKSGSLP